MMKRFSVLILCLSYLAATVPSSVMAERQIFTDGGRTNAKLAETKQERDARMKWWREARFGMFIHWGLYAVPAGEYKSQRPTRIGEWIMEWANIPRADSGRALAFVFSGRDEIGRA